MASAPYDEYYEDEDDVANPGRERRVGRIVIAILVVVLLLAAFVRMDAAAYAQGQVVVSDQRKAVQHREGGVVTAINVREGQRVSAGDILIEMAAPDLRAQERALTSDYLINLAQRSRLLALQRQSPRHPGQECPGIPRRPSQ